MGTSPLQRKIALESGGSHGATTLSELRQIQICRGPCAKGLSTGGWHNRLYN